MQIELHPVLFIPVPDGSALDSLMLRCEHFDDSHQKFSIMWQDENHRAQKWTYACPACVPSALVSRGQVIKEQTPQDKVEYIYCK